MRSKPFLRAAILGALSALFCALLLTFYFVRTPTELRREAAYAGVAIEVRAVRANIFMLLGAGGNITVQIGDDGVLVVDTQYDALGARNLAAIRTLSDLPIRYVINTHGHTDHVGGNAYFRSYGVPQESGEFEILTHENVVGHMIASGFGSQWLPTELYAGSVKEVHFNGERIVLTHTPGAHTGGDTFVHFQDSKVISAGDIYNGQSFPIIDRWKGGTTKGLIAALNELVAQVSGESGSEQPIVIPGHGEPVAQAEVIQYRDMVVEIVERIDAMIDNGMSLQQILAAAPTADYDLRYGSQPEVWSSGDFIAAIHYDLTRP